MDVGIVQVDGKLPNLALMKLSAWHKTHGDNVELYQPLFSRIDRLYASKIFNFSPDYQYWPNVETIKGGSGYDLGIELPSAVEATYPDYGLFGIDYAMGYTTRGCIRNCGFCIVPRKEGRIRPVADIYSFWNGQKQLLLLDNNLTADANHFRLILGQLIKHGIATDFSQGLDLRLIDDEKAILLSKVRLWKQIHFAWDNMKDESEVRQGITVLAKYMSLSRIMVYVLIGWDTTPEEDYYRVEALRGLGVDPFVMPFNKHDSYQRRFARWVNHKAIFKTVKWEDYLLKSR